MGDIQTTLCVPGKDLRAFRGTTNTGDGSQRIAVEQVQQPSEKFPATLAECTSQLKLLLDRSARTSYAAMLLKHVHDKEMYRHDGHVSFKSYLRASGLGRSSIFVYKKVADQFTSEDIARFGISKLAVLAHDGLPEEVRQAATRQGLPVRDEEGQLVYTPLEATSTRQLAKYVQTVVQTNKQNAVPGLAMAIRSAIWER